MSEPIKVLIVDDSRIFRSLVEESLVAEPDIKIVGSVMNGVKAIDFIKNNEKPDVLTLDINMPVMDGLETLLEVQKINESIIENRKQIGCIMLSSLTQAGSQVTIKSLDAGAFDFIPKPQDDNLTDNLSSLKSQLLEKVRMCYHYKQSNSFVQRKNLPSQQINNNNIVIEKASQGAVRVIAIGCSTGGPKALLTLIPELCSKTNLPILIVQHMPAGFTESLAESINKKSSHTVLEVQGGEKIESEHVYIAPGGKHMVVRNGIENEMVLGVNDQPPENGCRPSVDVLFRSVGTQYKDGIIAVVLTGMGTDGAKGIIPLHRAGAHIIVQNEETSVVWGMPGSAVKTGKVHEIHPIENIAAAIERNIK